MDHNAAKVFFKFAIFSSSTKLCEKLKMKKDSCTVCT